MPSTRRRDADTVDLETFSVDRLGDPSGGQARDLVFGALAAEDQYDAGTLLSHLRPSGSSGFTLTASEASGHSTAWSRGTR